ncbi:MAG: hypothetical protein LIO92_10885 [Clostridiales bacterium]|nr:hypothetical protein [Clostridiales bacterium]
MEQKVIVRKTHCLNGKDVYLFRIPNNTDDYIELTNEGCLINSIYIHDKNGNMKNVIDSRKNISSGFSSVTCKISGYEIDTGTKIWDVNEVGDNYVFLSLRVSEEESGEGVAFVIGARIMWVNLNRIVIDLYLTPNGAVEINLICNLFLQLSNDTVLSEYLVRTFCPEYFCDGVVRPVEQTSWDQLSFVTVEKEAQCFRYKDEQIKPMVEIVNEESALAVSAYSSMDMVTVEEKGVSILVSNSLEKGIFLKAGESYTGRVILGFDRIPAGSGADENFSSPFCAFV